MNFIARMKAAVVRRFSISDPSAAFSGQSSSTGETISETSVLALSAVWACVNLVAGTIGTLPMMIYRSDASGERKVARDHPLFRVLHDSPNYDQTAVDFWEAVAASLELWGNAYARIERTAGRVTALHPVAPQIMAVRRLANGSIEYSWSEDGQAYRVSDGEMLHVRGFGGNPLGGMSTLHFGRNSFGLAQSIDRAAGETFRNSLRPSGLLTFKEFLSADQRATAETKLIEKFAGAMNAGRPMVLEGGSEWKQLTINPEDAQMLESRAFSVEEICRFFGVPPFMVGHTEKSTSWGTGIEQQTLAFQKFTLRRRLKRIEQAVVKQLLTTGDRATGVKVEFNIEGLLRGDTASRFTSYQTGLQNGIYTINEVRALENLKPVPGGDVPRMQMQNMPITEAPHDDRD